MPANGKLTGIRPDASRPTNTVREMATDGPSTVRDTAAAARRARQRARRAPVDGADVVASPAPGDAPSATPDSPGSAPALALDYIAQDLRPLAFPISELESAPGNARKHGDRDVLALLESLRRFGQCKAVVGMCEYRGVSNVVLAGNGTLTAARRLGWSHLAVSWFEGSEAEARAFAIADNRTAELSTWDLDQLARDVADVDLGAWFAPADLADLLGSVAPSLDFPAVDESAQGQLDTLQRAPVTCPECGHSFTEGA